MVQIRPAVIDDLATIVEFQQRMAEETEGLPLDKATLEEGVRAVFLDPTKGEYFLAELDEEAVGGLLTVREWSDWRNGEVVWIHSLYVEPEARRQGVFKQLYLYLKHLVETTDELMGLRLYDTIRTRSRVLPMVRSGWTVSDTGCSSGCRGIRKSSGQ